MSTEEKLRISDPLVMKSAAGYYVGLQYLEEEFQAWLPYDRLTDYYATKEEAEIALKTFKSY